MGTYHYEFIDPGDVTPERAVQIRVWRVDEELTWRGVAAAAAAAWGSEFGEPVFGGGNQIAGRDLCTAAAVVLGEDPNTEPWN